MLAVAVQQPVSLITLPAAQHGRLGIPQSPQASAGSLAHRSRDHLDSGGFATRVSRSAPPRSCKSPLSRQELYESLVDLGRFPLSQGQTLKVLVVDDDSRALELIAVSIMGLASTVLRAHGGRAAGTAGRDRARPDDALAVFLLESVGHAVLSATRVEAGLTLARDEQPNLIVMDIQLPGMDGLEAGRSHRTGCVARSCAGRHRRGEHARAGSCSRIVESK